ncbi:DUF3592 domain-containing protein [Streptomyces sp. NPDC051322]|uniref:DUF3592 domain-containing protein n=1 Tax=Streptomyces sp. NPDC051322 TaxID=3154645 RepID=UPI00344DC760
MALFSCGLFAALWIPPHLTVNNLRSHGVTTPARVTAVNTHTKSVKVRFSASKHLVNTELYDASGMISEVETGDDLAVTYDPHDPSQVLAQSWLRHPPYVNLAVIGSGFLILFFTVGTAALILRRRHILRTYGRPPTPAPTQLNPGEPPIPLTKT